MLETERGASNLDLPVQSNRTEIGRKESIRERQCRAESVSLQRLNWVEHSNDMDGFTSVSVFTEGIPENHEVTHEDHLRVIHRGSPSRKVAQKLSSLLSKRNNRNSSDVSVYSDGATAQSHEGAQSVANFTVASSDTVKASNRSEKLSSIGQSESKVWRKLKCIVAGKKAGGSDESSSARTHSLSEDYVWDKHTQQRQRLHSMDSTRVRSLQSPGDQARIDQSIRARLDGFDLLTLGPAHQLSISPSPEYPCASILPWEDFPMYTFTGKSLRFSPADMVTQMLWSPQGKAVPEIILEGFIPGSDDRWSVPIEQRPVHPCNNVSILGSLSWSGRINSMSSGSTMPPDLAPATSFESDGSTSLPTHKLWSTLWGVQPAPVHVASVERMEDDDPLLHLAAEHSIPIDLDENTFCVSERQHLETVHNFVATALSSGHFRSAILILRKLLQGLDLLQDENLKYLKGATLHNLGMIHLWQGDFEKAVHFFHLAVEERTKCLPKDHPDIAVSMVRQAQAQLALGREDSALFMMEIALSTMPKNDISKAKLLNNIAVVHFLMRKFMVALQEFTTSLEIQRGWLEGSLRRDSTVHDASITLSNMGKLYMERSDYELAYYVFEEALLLQTTIYRSDTVLVQSTLKSLAMTKARDGQCKKALNILQGCLRSQNARFGKESSDSIEIIGLMGYMYEKLDAHDDALKCLTTVKKWQKANLPNDHPSLAKTAETIDRIEDILGTNKSVWV